MILKSMTAFVLEQSKIGMEVQSISHQLQNRADRFEKYVRYAKFLIKKLELWMFVPCDKDGNVLKNICTYNVDLCTNSKCMEYKNAKQRVLFEGFEYVEQLENKKDKKVPYHKFLYNGQFFYIEFEGTIERIVEREFELTPTAQKLIRL